MRLPLLSAVALALAAASPLAAQDLTYRRVPWNTSFERGTELFRGLGFTYSDQNAGVARFLGSGGCELLASFGSSGLYSVIERCVHPDGRATRARLAALRDSLRAAHGAPAQQQDDWTQWERDGTTLFVGLHRAQGDTTASVVFGASGLSAADAEAERELVALWQQYPEVENPERWTLLYIDEEERTLADRTTVERVGAGQVRVWVRMEYLETRQDEEGRAYNEALERWEVDCGRRRYRALSVTLRNEGAVVATGTFGPEQAVWEEIVPESIGEAKLEQICERSRSGW